MKRVIILAIICFCQISVFSQKKYEMVVEKNDGTEFVINVEDILRTYFRERKDNNDNNNNATALVGTWVKDYDEIGVIGIKFTIDGKAYYNEWSKWEQPNFDNVKSPANYVITGSTIRITHSSIPSYYEEYTFTLSDNNTISFNLVSYAETNHGLSGVFHRLQ